MKTTTDYKSLGPVGGAGSSAQGGGFVAGPLIAGKGNARGDSSPQGGGNLKAGGDVRMSTFEGVGVPQAAPAGQFAQGDMYAAQGGARGDSARGTGAGSPREGGDVRNGLPGVKGVPTASQSGEYNQGDQFAASKK